MRYNNLNITDDLILMIAYLILLIYYPYIMYLKYQKKNLSDIYSLLKDKLFGKTAFSTMISCVSPYSGSVKPYVNYFDNNFVKCSINESFFIKNPFNSIHALALGNLGELTSGLLMMNYLQRFNKKGIVTQINIKFHKKARNTIYAISHIKSLRVGIIKSKIYDQEKFLVAEVLCKWEIKNN